jgi:predicted HAD superfamily Cof-like phosphohydrolase
MPSQFKTAKAAAIHLHAQAPAGPRKDLLEKLIESNDWDRKMALLHEFMETPAPQQPVELSVSSREQRLHYILSEFLELVDASGFELATSVAAGPAAFVTLTKSNVEFHHREGSQQDRIEMLDGLADLLVVVIGMAVEMGQKMNPIFQEVVLESATKVDPETLRVEKNDGIKVPDEPVGKWIKGAFHTKAGIQHLITMPKEIES